MLSLGLRRHTCAVLTDHHGQLQVVPAETREHIPVLPTLGLFASECYDTRAPRLLYTLLIVMPDARGSAKGIWTSSVSGPWAAVSASRLSRPMPFCFWPRMRLRLFPLSVSTSRARSPRVDPCGKLRTLLEEGGWHE
jgi:hypothetical protein